MSGSSILLVPSAARTIALSPNGGPAIAAWPNANSTDVLDYWVDCNNVVQDAGGNAVSAIAAVALSVLSGDAALQILAEVTLQNRMVGWWLTGGTPGATYELMASINFASALTRTYTRVGSLYINTGPANAQAVAGSQQSALSTQLANAQAALNAVANFTTQQSLTLAGQTMAAPQQITAALTIITTGGGVLQVSTGVNLRVVNETNAALSVLPPTGTAWAGGGVNVPATLPANGSLLFSIFPNYNYVGSA